MKYQFMRLQSDGRMSSIAPPTLFNTISEAKKAGPDFLATKRCARGSIVLVEVLEVVIATSHVRYETWSDETKKKFGLISSERI
jgi:hypothetical protein